METGIHELTAGYALDALDPDERARFEAHLPAASRCQEELGAFWETTEALAVAASGPEPSADLRSASSWTCGRNHPGRRTVRAAPATPSPVLAAAAAIAAVIAIGIGLWASSLSSELDDTRAALERERAAAEVLVDPAHAR